MELVGRKAKWSDKLSEAGGSLMAAYKKDCHYDAFEYSRKNWLSEDWPVIEILLWGGRLGNRGPDLLNILMIYRKIILSLS